MKNIAFITPHLKSGGSERMASRLTKLFSEKYNVYYIVFDDTDVSYDIAGELININAPMTKCKPKKVYNLIKRVLGIRRICREKNIDVVFSFTSVANLAMRCSHLKCKTYGACRGFEDLKLHTKNYHKVIKSGADILFNAKEMEEFYRERYPEDAGKLHTIENLFDCEDIIEKSKEALEDEVQSFYNTHKVITTVGIASRHKGQWDLLKSFELLKERVPDAGLVIMGNHRGAYKNELAEMASKSKYAEDILLLGHRSNTFKYVAKSNVFAFPSISEGFPNALVEALLCRTPAVATLCSTGPREVMFDEYTQMELTDSFYEADNGIVTPCFDGNPDFDYNNTADVHRTFADALYKMMTDQELRYRCVENAYKRALRNDEAAISDRYFKLIEG